MAEDTRQLAGDRQTMTGPDPLQRRLRLFAAAVAGVMAILYLLIGFRVADLGGIDPNEQAVFGLVAGVWFVGSAVVLLVVNRRIVWVVGALVQVFIILIYFNLAPDREPSFEEWGISIRIVQIPLLVALAWLAWRSRKGTDQRELEVPSSAEASGGLPTSSTNESKSWLHLTDRRTG